MLEKLDSGPQIARHARPFRDYMKIRDELQYQALSENERSGYITKGILDISNHPYGLHVGLRFSSPNYGRDDSDIADGMYDDLFINPVVDESSNEEEEEIHLSEEEEKQEEQEEEKEIRELFLSMFEDMKGMGLKELEGSIFIECEDDRFEENFDEQKYEYEDEDEDHEGKEIDYPSDDYEEGDYEEGEL